MQATQYTFTPSLQTTKAAEAAAEAEAKEGGEALLLSRSRSLSSLPH